MNRWNILAAVASLGIFSGVGMLAPHLGAVTYTSEAGHVEATATSSTSRVTETTDTRPTVDHEPLPEDVRAIYMTSCVAGTKSFRDKLISLIDETELNSVVIDIKDYSGTISFPPESSSLKPAWSAARCGTSDMQDFVETLHQKGIYVIGRISVFQDPFYTDLHPELAVKKADGVSVWEDYKGLSFIDVGATDYWNYILDLSINSYNIGFDELNYDYMRYPSDGPMSDIAFTKSKDFPGDDNMQANLESFFKYLNEKLDDPTLFASVRHENTGRTTTTPWTSVDLFGMVTTNYDDLSIGQVIERAAPYFDFIAPMVYPSHYPDSFLGLGNPNKYPYKVVNYAMASGVERMTATTTVMQGFLHTPINTTNASGTASFTGEYEKPVWTADKLRTWIQDFDYGGDYDATDVRNEIQASYDAGVKSWMIWAPSNVYTREALLSADEE